MSGCTPIASTGLLALGSLLAAAVAAAAARKVNRSRRLIVLLACLPLGVYGGLRCDELALLAQIVVTLPLLLGVALFLPSGKGRVDGLTALAASGLLWLGYLGAQVVRALAAR